MTFGFPVRGIDDSGRLQPVSGGFHYLKFGVSPRPACAQQESRSH